MCLRAMEKLVVAEGNGVGASRGNTVSIEKELFNGVPTAAAAENKRLGGRKMVSNNVLRKEMIRKEEDLNRGTSKISGATHSVGKCNPERKGELNVECKLSDRSHLPVKVNMNNGNMIEPKTLNSASMEISGMSDQESHDHFQKSESQKLLEAANEIVNLMHKDYTGMDKPRRTPPINNHQPLDEENVQP
ncbi:hypothetical protein HHK36_015093 [Tetracentron sinense]|uniref:Uncharacterized protein n=1 Tax=Tetracentron sinense TaxID=13715 RepID=A0A835DCG5_TETSI|nr:hypothetical protein HHK36_015093 [Tetracentron sinense]